MEVIKYNFKYISIFILMFMLVLFFPLTVNDLYFSRLSFSLLKSLVFGANGYILSSYIALILVNIRLLRILFYVGTTISLFILIKNIVNKKNQSLFYMAIFLFFLTNNVILASSYVNTTQFSNTFVPISFIFIIIYYLVYDKLYKLKRSVVYLLGIISTILNPIYSLTLFIALSIKVFGKQDKSLIKLYSGVILGFGISLVSVLNNGTYKIPNISFNITHNIIPKIMDINVLLITIFSVFLLYLASKIYKHKKNLKQNMLLSIGIFVLYVLACLFSKSLILNYIIFIFYIASSFYVLLNCNNSIRFNNKIKIYYLFKVVYLLSLCFSNRVVEGDILFIIVINILIIVELINYLLPNNYLYNTWFILACVLLLSNVYIYGSVYNKYQKMNTIIKNNLECDKNVISLQLKYETNYLYRYIPYTNEEKDNYLKYYNISYKDDYDIYFNK